MSDPLASAPSEPPHGVPRCTARAKSTGHRCLQPAVPGAKVCRFHGGRAPQVAAAASVRVRRAEAAATLAALVPADAPPVTDVAGELGRLAGELVAARDAAAGMVREVRSLTHPITGAPSAELELWLATVDRCSKLLEGMARLGIDAKRQGFERGQVDALVGVLRDVRDWMLGEMRAGVAPEAIEAGMEGVFRVAVARHEPGLGGGRS